MKFLQRRSCMIIARWASTAIRETVSTNILTPVWWATEKEASLPLFAFDFTQWKSVALFLIFFLTLGFLCVKHETFTVNIVLEVFGYQFYRCDLEDEDGNGITWMIISRTDLKGCVGDSVYLRPLNNECRLDASTR